MATIVGYPLTPEILNQIGYFNYIPPLPAGFDPQGNWTQTYRVFTNHGYLDKSNELCGTLEIERLAGSPSGPFVLNVRQEIENDRGIFSHLNTEIQCTNNQLASPFQWHLLSKSTENGIDLAPDVTIEEVATVNGANIDVLRNTVPLTRPGSLTLSSDWCMFEAIQRRAFTQGSPLTFDSLDNMSLLKKNQSLVYRGTYPITLGAESVTLHWFHQLGNGFLPYEYWLDENHRLVLAVTLSRAYILTSTPTPVVPETVFQSFDSDPTGQGWTNGAAGSTTFSYNAAGWLDAVVHRDSANRALYTKALSKTYDKTAEFWWEMDIEMVSSADNMQQCHFGVFDSTSPDNHHNTVADRFFYIETGSGTPKGNRHDAYGYDSEGNEIKNAGSPSNPSLPFGTALRVKGHYWYEDIADAGMAKVTVHAINADGSTGAELMATDSEIVIAAGKSLAFDTFGIGNRTNGGLSDGQTIKVDNFYFSNVGENPSPILPSFYS
jgi:hypothetical protein